MGNSGLIRRDFYNPLIKGIFGLLDATKPTDIGGNDVKVCDFLQKDTGFPYVQIGVSETPALWDCKDEAGEQVLATIRIWDNQSLHEGFKNVNKIAGEVLTTLTTTDIDLTGDGFRIGHYRITSTNLTTREDNGILSRIINIVFFITDTSTVQV